VNALVMPTHLGTSGYTQIAKICNDFASAIALLASRITNTASELATAETLHVWTNSADRITSIDTPQHALGATALGADRTSNAGVAYQNSEVLFELRILTDFTWDQIARLFSVSRRTVHLWAGGGPMSRENEEHLHRMLGILRHADRGRTGDNRAALLSATNPVNRCAFDLLAARDYESALEALQPREHSPVAARQFVPSAELLAERAPLPLDVLLSARNDDLPRAARHGRPVRYRKATRNS
jgi:hypothetical protein